MIYMDYVFLKGLVVETCKICSQLPVYTLQILKYHVNDATVLAILRKIYKCRKSYFFNLFHTDTTHIVFYKDHFLRSGQKRKKNILKGLKRKKYSFLFKINSLKFNLKTSFAI